MSTHTAQTMIQDGTTFDATTQVLYTKPKTNASGGKNVGLLNQSSKKSLYLSTPLMLTWGVNTWEPDQPGGRTSYDMALQFPKSDYATEETTAFLTAMQEMEAKLKADAVENSKEWFNKSKMSAEVIDALFSPMLKYPKGDDGEPDTSRAPTLKVKMPFYDNKFNVELYDMNSAPLFPNTENPDLSPVDLIQKGQNVALVIQSGGIWFANGKFGTTWRLVQAVVQPRVSVLGNRTCYVPLTASARSTLQEEADQHEDNVENGESVTAVVEDSDDETDMAAAVQAEVKEVVDAAPKVVKKKVVRKRKPKASDGENA